VIILLTITSMNNFPPATLDKDERIKGVPSRISDGARRIFHDALLNIAEGSPRDSFIKTNAEDVFPFEDSPGPFEELATREYD